MTESPYAAPRSSYDRSPSADVTEVYIRRQKFWLKWIWASFAGVIVPPVFGLLGRVIGMSRAFGKLGRNADPEQLAGDISFSLWATMIGFSVSLIFFFVLIVALIRYVALRNLTKSRLK